MGSFRIASRYSKSLIQLAQEKGVLEQAFADMNTVNAALDGSRDMQMLFKSPIIPTDKKLTIIKKIFEGKISDMVYQFMVLMTKKGREGYLSEIVDEFITQYNVINGITPVQLITAVKLDSGLVQTMVKSLKAKEFLKEVELTEEVDEDIVGGFILKYGDKMIDQSVRRRLNELYAIVADDSYIKKYS